MNFKALRTCEIAMHSSKYCRVKFTCNSLIYDTLFEVDRSSLLLPDGQQNIRSEPDNTAKSNTSCYAQRIHLDGTDGIHHATSNSAAD